MDESATDKQYIRRVQVPWGCPAAQPFFAFEWVGGGGHRALWPESLQFDRGLRSAPSDCADKQYPEQGCRDG